jgi:PAS domain S-box-containing protein
MNLLIVDDQPTDLKLLRAQLESEGHVVFEAHDGVDALALLERQRVDAVISDVLMPRMDGYRLCHEIRKCARLRDLPIIIHTATYTAPEDEKLALNMGANKYLKKPASVATIVAALHEVIAQPHAAPRADALREIVVLKEYNERLVSKLKEKNTELLAQTEALRASDEHYRSITRSATDAIITADAAGRICNWNRGAEHIFGYGENEVCGQPLEMIMPPRYRDQHHGGMQRVLAAGEAHVVGQTVELAGLHRDGREFPLELSLSQWETSEGRFFTAIIRDITERQRAEREILSLNEGLEQRVRERTAELGQSNRDLQRRNQEVQAFYHTLSHELKTPLTSAREFVAIVMDGLAGPLTETQLEYLGIAKESCDQLRLYINDLLDVTRLETGKMSIEFQALSLAALVKRVVAMLAPAAAGKGISLSCDCQPDLPAIRLDQQRIQQVLTNLTTNALKFTPAGGQIRVSVSESPASPECLQVAVRDTGRGMPKDQLDLIFNRLYQLNDDNSSAKATRGLGLGLYICQELVQLHGGRIWVESEPGQGSTFTFTIPKRQEPASGNVLVVDDEAAVQCH